MLILKTCFRPRSLTVTLFRVVYLLITSIIVLPFILNGVKPRSKWNNQQLNGERRLKRIKQRIRNLVKLPNVRPLVFIHLTKDGRVNLVGHPYMVNKLNPLDLGEIFVPQTSEEKNKPKVHVQNETEVLDLRGVSVLIDEENVSKCDTLRRIVRQLVIPKGKGARSIWGIPSKRPPFWPEDVPFVGPTSTDPASGCRLLHSDSMRRVISSWKRHAIQMLKDGVEYKNSADSEETLNKYAPEKSFIKIPSSEPVITSRPTNSAIRYNGIVVSAEDMTRIGTNAYIDDNVVNCFILYQINHLGLTDEVKLLDSNFAQTLSACRTSPSDEWFNRENLFTREVLLLPICDRSHWTLAVFHVKSNILYMLCSLGGKYPEKANTIIRFLKRHGATHQVDINEISIFHPEVPCQQNGVDCGVFVCFYAKALMEMPDIRQAAWGNLVNACGITKFGRTKLLATFHNLSIKKKDRVIINKCRQIRACADDATQTT